ncbi:MAG: sigma-70 family RNA polymerase sigma factor [Peptostreptococcaceae bacterium]|nr:sigma-70 family RNA polymerase sigma factor [Peptostreptococcaceae bacterium]
MSLEVTNLFELYDQTKSLDFRNQIVEKNLYLVDILIKKYRGKGVENDDLYQVGALALVKAAERFDYTKGYEFASFATPTIIGEIKKHFRDKQWSLKVPRRLKEISLKVNKAREELTNEGNQSITVKALAERTGYSEEDIIEALEAANAYSTYSIDKTLDDENGENAGVFLDRYLGFEDLGYERLEVAEIIKEAVARLTERQRYVFKERFIYNRSQDSLAKTLNVSQMTVSREEKAIINILRSEIRR